MPHSNTQDINIGIGACLVGHAVRYNGEHKRRQRFIDDLGEHVRLVPFCPEVGIGLGVPREPVRIVLDGEERLMDSNTQTVDYSSALDGWTNSVAPALEKLSGYILVKGSPSCGLERVNRYTAKGNFADKDGVGIFTRTIQQRFPMLPVEEDGRLNDPRLRERFMCRVYAYHDWRQLCQTDFTGRGLVSFWSRHKYLVMSRHYESYRRLGRMVAAISTVGVEETFKEFGLCFMAALERPANRKGHVNVLQHVKGYFKRKLDNGQRRDLDEVIEDYRRGRVPLVVPLRLLQHHIKALDNEYLANQSFFSPYPAQLGLRNPVAI